MFLEDVCAIRIRMGRHSVSPGPYWRWALSRAMLVAVFVMVTSPSRAQIMLAHLINSPRSAVEKELGKGKAGRTTSGKGRSPWTWYSVKGLASVGIQFDHRKISRIVSIEMDRTTSALDLDEIFRRLGLTMAGANVVRQEKPGSDVPPSITVSGVRELVEKTNRDLQIDYIKGAGPEKDKPMVSIIILSDQMPSPGRI